MRGWVVLALLVPGLAVADTHRLKPTLGHSTFAVRPPILTVKPGDVVESETLWGDWYEKPGGRWPGEVGPIAVDGAEPGDTLVVEVLKVRPNRATAVSTQGGWAAMFSDRLPWSRHVWRLDLVRMTGTVELSESSIRSVTVPLQPRLGRVAVAPEGDSAFDGVWPGTFGGNMDVADVREGTMVYLPVFHEGGLFYFGDGHALQDGELCGSRLGTSMDVAFRFGLLKRKAIARPRLEDAEHLMAAGSARPLSEALRIAAADLVEWLVADHGFDRADAYQLVSQVAILRVAIVPVGPFEARSLAERDQGNVADPLYAVVAKFPKRFLPARAAAGTTRGIRLGDVPWTEAEKVLTPERIVVLPVGAGSKQHGLHLPLRTDEIEAEYLARRVVEARPVALLPTLTYGYYSTMLEYPGTVSLSLTTMRDAVIQICRSIATHGPRRFYVLNTGLRTADALNPAVGILAKEGILMRFTDVRKAGRAAEDAVRQQAYGTHADEIETSTLLYIAPGVVRMEEAAADGGVVRPGALTRDPRNTVGHYSPSGVFGDPTLATWQKGERVTEGTVFDILREIDDLSRISLPLGAPRSPLEGGGPP